MFQSSVLRSYLERQEQQLSSKKLGALYLKFQSYFGNEAIQSNYKNSKETSLQGEFISDLFRDILGYTPNPRPNFNLRREEKNETDAKTRLVRFRGLLKHTFYLHLKECEFRLNHRKEYLYQLILKIIRKCPLF